MAWKAGGADNLPLADRDREWDGDAAEDHIFAAAGWGKKPDPAQAQKAFFAYNDSEPEKKSSYKLPFADIIDGKLTAVPRAIFAVAQVLEGARGGVDLPKEDIAQVRKKVTAYYRKMGDKPPW